MNMLVIGNGFDLAHGLPTKYVDFLNFVKIFDFAYTHDCLEGNSSALEFCEKLGKNISGLSNLKLKKEMEELMENLQLVLMKFEDAFEDEMASKAYRDLHDCIYQNRWIEYFQYRYDKNLIEGENWIDLETEVKNVITLLESDSFEIQKRQAEKSELEYVSGKIEEIETKILREKYKTSFINGSVY